jgi:hypothetical protein
LYVLAPLFFKFLGRLVEEKIHNNILLFSLKTLTYSMGFSGSRVNISVLASLSVTGRFSLVPSPHWVQEKSA